MTLDPVSTVLGVLIGLALAVARHLFNGRTKRPAKAATFPEKYIPAEGHVTTVLATYERLLAYAYTKGCTEGQYPDKDGEAFLFWPTDPQNFSHYIDDCNNRLNAPAALEIYVWADMSVHDELLAIRAIDRLDRALNEAATSWFKNDHPDLRRESGTMYFNVYAGDNRLNFSFIHEVDRRAQKLREAEAQRVAEARSKAAEPGPGAAKGVSGGITCVQ